MMINSFILNTFEFLFFKINQKGLFKMQKRRQKNLVTTNDKKSTSIQMRSHSIENSSPLPNLHIVHRSTCRLYQPTEALCVPKCSSTSLNPYLIDAPAASPEISIVMDSTNTPNHGIELQIIPSASVVNSSVTPTLSPLKLTNRLINSTDVADIICADVNTTPSANNILEHFLVDTMDKKTNIQFCECHRQDDISEDDDDDDDNNDQVKKEKKKSKVGLFLHRYCLSYFTKFRQLISSFVASKYFRRIVLSAIVINGY
jgi:hypothetical protein